MSLFNEGITTIELSKISIFDKSTSEINTISVFLFFSKVFISLFNKLPSLNIFEKVTYLFGKFSVVIKAILIISVSVFSSYLIYISSLFIRSSLLIDVDILPISILLFTTAIYLGSKGITSITRTSIISFFIFVIF